MAFSISFSWASVLGTTFLMRGVCCGGKSSSTTLRLSATCLTAKSNVFTHGKIVQVRLAMKSCVAHIPCALQRCCPAPRWTLRRSQRITFLHFTRYPDTGAHAKSPSVVRLLTPLDVVVATRQQHQWQTSLATAEQLPREKNGAAEQTKQTSLISCCCQHCHRCP